MRGNVKGKGTSWRARVKKEEEEEKIEKLIQMIRKGKGNPMGRSVPRSPKRKGKCREVA